MSKKILASTLICSFLLSAEVASAQGLALGRSLVKGSRGADVTALQQFLAGDPSVYPEGLVTGYFGQLTAQAVSRFQAKHGIETVGVVGPKTRAKLQSLSTLGAGNSGKIPPGLANRFPLATSSTTTPPFVPGNNASSTPGQQITMCHIPPGNPAAKSTITIGLPAANAHLAHGDTIGACSGGGTGTTTPPTADVTAPIISSLVAQNLSTTSVTIAWQTDELSDSALWYGTTSPLDPFATTTTLVSNATLVTSHSLGLSSLTASTTYYYIVRSRDAVGNSATSTQSIFTTL